MCKGKRRLKFRIDSGFLSNNLYLRDFLVSPHLPCFSYSLVKGIIIPYVCVDALGSGVVQEPQLMYYGMSSHCLQSNRTLRLFVCFYLTVFHPGCPKDAIERKEKLFCN